MTEPDQLKERQDKRKNQRNDKLKEIEALYRSQIKQIYSSKDKPEQLQSNKSIEPPKRAVDKKLTITNFLPNDPQPDKTISQIRSVTNLNSISSTSRLLLFDAPDERARASTLLRGESTRTIQILRKQNQTKQLKIRELSNKCECLVDKLKKYLSSQEFENEVQNLKEFSQGKAQRMQNLLKIKNEQILFRIKLQVVNLLQEFGLSKEQLSDANQIDGEGALFSFLSRKLKGKLKDFRSKQQETNLVQQKDRILSEKQQQRIHFLTQTNQLLKLSESKLKGKVEDLKSQLNEYLERIRQRETESQERESEIFRLRRQNDELHNVNVKLSTSVKGVNNDKVDERRVWQAKEKQMKLLLNNYFVEKKKLESLLQQKDGQLQEVIIRQKFVEQENERLNRQLVRWKERFNWLQKEKENSLRQMQEEKTNILNQFEEYKLDNNQGILMGHRTDVEQALRKIQEYQQAYQQVLLQLQDERRLLQRSQQQAQNNLEKMEREWLDKIKKINRAKDQEIAELQQDSEARISDIQEQFQQKQQLLAEEMQARLKSLLAQKDKKNTELTISLETQNDELRGEINNLMRVLQVKESLIHVISSKKGTSE